MTGTPNQISWAEVIRLQVAKEFDRVAAILTGRGRMDLVEILNEHRLKVLANESAGYFIREWGEMTGQVSRMIVTDPRYNALRRPPQA